MKKSLLLLLLLGCTPTKLQFDRGFSAQMCHDFPRELKWDVKAPLKIHVDPAAVDWIPALDKATLYWNRVVGRDVFSRKVHFILPNTRVGDTQVVIVGHGDPNRAVTMTLWNDQCKVFRTITTVMQGGPEDRALLLTHELGHVLGLDHDEYKGWIMNPEYSRMGRYISDSDKRLLRRQYGGD